MIFPFLKTTQAICLRKFNIWIKKRWYGLSEEIRVLNKLQEVEALISRAEEHLKWLRDCVVHPDPNLSAEKEGFYFVPESGDIFAAKIRIVVGEFASCLRNALNYLTCALAEQESGVCANSVQFPLESSPESFGQNRTRYLRGIPDEHLAFFERFQPYSSGKPFELLRELSNAYRHRELIRVEKKFQRTELPTPPPKTERLPAGHVVRTEYFAMALSLPDGSAIVPTLEEIERCVRQTLDEFKVPLRHYLRGHE